MPAPRLISTRRELVVAGGTLAAGLALTTPAHARLLPGTRGIGRGRFLDGVASGEPGPNAVTFWGRLSTSRPRSAARLVVASDAGLRNTVATAVVPTSAAVDHTLKVRIGGLKPSTRYWYAWQSADDVSPIGRTKTAPPADSRTPVTVAYSSCQSYPHGFFNGHRDAARFDEIDVYAQLGDYTYEYEFGEYGDLRGGDGVDFPSTDLTSYRAKLRLYRADPALRELHRLHPVVHTWDDHEVADNYTDGEPAPSPGQRNAGYRASFEWLPRIAFPGDRFRVYRSLRYGANAELFMLDERQYRTPGVPGTTILGRRQMDWLKQGLRGSGARWKLVGNPDLLAPLGLNPTGEPLVDPINVDGWAGYPAERRELLAHLADNRIDDVALLTGDVHMFMANDLLHGGRSVATEYMGGSITSPGLPAALVGVATPVLQLANPHIRYLEGAKHGWAIARVDPDELRIEFRTSDVRVDGAPSTTLASFVQRRGQNRVEQAAGAPGGGTTRVLGRDPVDAPAAVGSPLAARRARVARAAKADLTRRVALGEQRAARRTGAARRALAQDRRARRR
ncbi:alkaline phosphatase D family protein [Patulibacter defluvii]|uniref:alkaline phosphatase D family protein n=1 Tax=Patulibacter defluvii TaxID=3095358 RepID=UPI002A74ED83|nr:alkaline phosphatase D family protein [Patulibacter sp. DM4]